MIQTILLFIKCINDVLKNMPTLSKSIYMYINSVMIEFRNDVLIPLIIISSIQIKLIIIPTNKYEDW